MTDSRPEIVRLTHDYALANDTFDVDAVVGLFLPDGVFDMRPIGLDAYRGHAEIRDFFERERRALAHVMHVTTNHRIDVEGDEGTGTVYYLAIGVVRRSGEENQSRGYYEDRYVRTAAGWRFRSRVGQALIPWTPARSSEAK